MAVEGEGLLLPPALLECTPSRRDGISEGEEAERRFFGTQLIAEAGVLLRLPQVAIATAQSCFHRLYFRRSFRAFDAHHVSMASLFLAGKVEESTRRMRDILNVVYHVKCRWEGRAAGRVPPFPTPPIVLGGSLYTTWKAALVRCERFILRDLGFAMYAVSDAHPHKLLVYYLKALAGSDELAARAWAALNDSLRTDLCVRAPPSALAVAAVLLGSRQCGFALPTGSPWYAVFTACSWEEVGAIAAEIDGIQRRTAPPVWLPSLRPDALPTDDVE
jgi:hypothetical protein